MDVQSASGIAPCGHTLREKRMTESNSNRERRSGAQFCERELRRTTHSRGNRRGWSLVELLIVLTMLAIVAAMGLLKLNTTGSKVDAAAQLARTLMQLAQRDAVTRQSNVIL